MTIRDRLSRVSPERLRRDLFHLCREPHGKMVEVRDQEAYNIEKSAEFLSWQTGDDYVTLNMIFGARTAKEEETMNLDKPAPKFAPLKSIELIVSGPRDEVAALQKRIDRQTFAALLGSVVN